MPRNSRQWIAAIIVWTVLIALSSGCVSTPQGESIRKAQILDLTTTAVAVVTKVGTEVNPAGAALIPLKLTAGTLVEALAKNCLQRTQIAMPLNSVTYGLSANNLAVIVGVSGSGAPIIGMGVALLYAVFHKEIEPETYDCEGG